MFHILSPNSTLGRWLVFLLDAALISVAWAVCCIPVITVGAATSAVHRVAQNWVRHRADCDLKAFFQALRENLRRGTGVWLILLLPLVLILADGYLIWLSPAELPGYMQWMFYLSAFVWLATAVYAFALQAAFENPPFRTVGNALRIAVSHLPRTLLLMVIFGLAIFLTLLYPFGAFFYVPAGVFFSARFTWNVFSAIFRSGMAGGEPEENEGE